MERKTITHLSWHVRVQGVREGEDAIKIVADLFSCQNEILCELVSADEGATVNETVVSCNHHVPGQAVRYTFGGHRREADGVHIDGKGT
jgi:hypothetical protein